ncbi:hypothetical protein GCM10009547_16960 [Sporichthya brevicatena]|uniref:Uncharacterized protein n=1 Tax=Sporichthya brevicatena TaxID=171442 RepID=A0ABN1GP81_9ACTN
MRTPPRITLALTAALTALTLTACGGDDDEPEQSAQEIARRQSEQLQQETIQKATVDALFGALCGIRFECGGINEELKADPKGATEDARAICTTMQEKDEAAARAEARKRFSNDKFQVTDQKAEDVVRILKLKICPDL